MHEGKLFHDLSALLKTPEPAGLGPARRPGTLALARLDKQLDAAFEDAVATPAVFQLLRALIYLWHDHLPESHALAQEIENHDGSLVHGIMHRREPDYANAKYWFRRAGSHPSYLSLSVAAGEFLHKHEESELGSRLVPNKMWDPFAFVDAVEETAEGRFRSKIPVLEQIQRIEFECLLENIVNRIG